nr:site-specific integrase [Rhodococcus sp. ACS1]
MRGAGPLVPFAEGFEEELRRLGHRPGAIRHHMVLMGQLDRWLTGEGLAVEDLSIALVEGFLASRRASGRRRVPTVATVARLLEYLRDRQVVPLETLATPTSRDEMLVRYRHHLIVVRGLAPTTIRRYERFARRFLAGRASRTGDEIGIGNLTGTEVAEWMLEAGSRLTVESAKREAADLRALLRFLYLDGILETDLGGAISPVASWRGARLPATMSAADVDTLLAGCDRRIASGRRDRAILMLLARLGLRSGEVAALRLGDVDWRAGEIVVRARPAAAIVSRSPSTSVRPSSTTSPTGARCPGVRSCCSPSTRLHGPCTRARSPGSSTVRVGEPAWHGSVVTGSGTRWRPSCCAGGPI